MDELFEAIGRIFDGEHIVIDISEYDEKMIAERERDNLLRILFSNSELDYNKTGLRFDSYHIWEYLKDVYPNTYMKRLTELLDEQAEESDGNPV